MTTALATADRSTDRAPFLTESDLGIIRRTIAKDADDAEFQYFVKVATLRQLNPLLNQISLQIRNANDATKRASVVITTIHGLRLIASRTGNYMPGRDTTFITDDHNNLVSATAYVKKYHPSSGTWHEISETAYWSEFVQTYRNGDLMGLWASKPRLMLAKCAEALALRRAFPEDLSGLYTDDEMGQADLPPAANPATGEIIDGAASSPQATDRPVVHKPAPRPALPAGAPTANGSRATGGSVTKIQRANLIGNYCELYGGEPDTAAVGLDAIFVEKFGHGLDTATYNEGAVVMAHLLQLKQQAAA